MKPGIYNMEIEQGSTYHKTWTVLDNALDLSQYAGVRMKIRLLPGSRVIWDSEAETPGGTIAIEGTDKVNLVIDSATTSAMDFSEAHYDVELYKAGTPEVVDKLIKGKAILNKENTY